jgi:hypothetical protein
MGNNWPYGVQCSRYACYPGTHYPYCTGDFYIITTWIDGIGYSLYGYSTGRGSSYTSFLGPWPWTVLFYGMWRRVLWYKLVDVTEQSAASISRAVFNLLAWEWTQKHCVTSQRTLGPSRCYLRIPNVTLWFSQKPVIRISWPILHLLSSS